MTAPRLLDRFVHFRFVTGDASVTGVRLDADPAIDGARAFRRDEEGWLLKLPRPPVQRFEYRFDVERGPSVETILDPDNPVTVRTAFGYRSVMEMPRYHPPWWLFATAPEGSYDPMQLGGETADDVPVTIWSPAGTAATDPLPLLLVHDGPEYDLLSSITSYSAALIHAGRLPAHRLALAHPVLRDAWYSGSPRYLRTIATTGLARIGERYAVRPPVVVMGASLGGLTALLVGMIGSKSIGGVFAQSGSFFQPPIDPEESGFRYFHRISERVRQILLSTRARRPLRIGMTCGALEENASNNRQMAAALTRAGHRVSYAEVADLHNYTAWRDALDPYLTDVLRDTWGEPQG